MYFFEIPHATLKLNLRKFLIERKDLSILSFPGLFKYIANEILQAFKDLAYKCNY